VLCAREVLGTDPFGIVNGDDVYGAGALECLYDRLANGQNVIVAFKLTETILSDEPVTRGVALCDPDGRLTGLSERKNVRRHDDRTFTSEDGSEPRVLDPESLVSMNLWGFQPGIWDPIFEAVVRDHPGIRPDGTIGPGSNPETETLLPEVVGDAVASGSIEVVVAPGTGRCVGVTHADDLAIARGELARMIGRGERAESLWQIRR
jgi:hypothetical protein